jgi:ketosteroid isomerase-like protein
MNRLLLPLYIAAACFIFARIHPASADSPSTTAAEQEIRDLERKFEHAVLKGDVAFFERVLAKNFLHTTQTGKMRDREQWLANHKAGQSSYDALNVDQLTVHIYGDSAVVTAVIKPTGHDSQGKPIEGQYRFLRVWAKQSGAWQVVAFQSTRVADAQKGANP